MATVRAIAGPSRAINGLHAGGTCVRGPAARFATAAGEGSARVYPIRKQYLCEKYAHILGTHDAVVFIRHHAVSPREWKTLRAQIVAKDASDEGGDAEAVKLAVIRTGLLSPVFDRLVSDGVLTDGERAALAPHMAGPLAIAAQRTLAPERLKRAIDAIARANKTTIGEGATPDTGKFPFVVGLMLRRTADETAVRRFATLPPLSHLHGQIVSLIGAPAGRIAGTLHAARGATLSRTLEGYHKGLSDVA